MYGWQFAWISNLPRVAVRQEFEGVDNSPVVDNEGCYFFCSDKRTLVEDIHDAWEPHGAKVGSERGGGLAYLPWLLIKLRAQQIMWDVWRCV